MFIFFLHLQGRWLYFSTVYFVNLNYKATGFYD